MPKTYDADSIEVLEGLEPVRRRPGMYIGGTDVGAYHHMVNEIVDNATDEAIAGHASVIDVELVDAHTVRVKDNGRGIPVDPHPKFPDRSALEVIMTTLHSGGKFSGKAYQTAGGLHGVGLSVVNALSEKLDVDVWRDGKHYTQTYAKGAAQGKIAAENASRKGQTGTQITFSPDTSIFVECRFDAAKLFSMIRAKAYLFSGVKIRWKCAADLIDGTTVPESKELHFPNGLKDFLEAEMQQIFADALTPKKGDDEPVKLPEIFAGTAELDAGADGQSMGKVEWAIAWPGTQFDGVVDGLSRTYCNTVITPLGGTHESGMRSAVSRAIREYAGLVGEKVADKISSDDVVGGAYMILSLFLRDPQFQGQTKEKLVSSNATKLVDSAMRDKIDLWLGGNTGLAKEIIEHVIDRMDARLARRRKAKVTRKTPLKRLRLPGKLSDCSRQNSDGTEIFIVEGDSAGGSAKQARNRETQAILPLRGKVMNVISASASKIAANQEISHIATALGVDLGKKFNIDDLRYERVIIMTDADVDGAHIAALLIALFYTKMPGLIEAGQLYLAQPPLYRLAQGKTVMYAMDDDDKDALIAEHFDAKRKIDVSRFKGLGEMPAKQLKETTLDPSKRTLLRVSVADGEAAKTAAQDVLERLMGRSAESRYDFIQANAAFAEVDV